MVEMMPGKREFRLIKITGLAPYGTEKGQNKENFDKSLKNVLLTNHWPECIDI